MQVTRYYTDDGGVTRIEQVDPVQDELWSRGHAGTINVRQVAAGTVMDWHHAPRRQIVIHLAGRLEVGLEDGTTQLFGPGDARLMDNLTGKGHRAAVVSDEPVVAAVIVLD